ncbi:MAG: lysozyme [Spirochaetae bacterium HGW-Spirochaetae-1]|jgi:lysozyme|nr:MAG: lysozyme [Spirochaetae bacterium HGW-Spirochaetae-1]
MKKFCLIILLSSITAIGIYKALDSGIIWFVYPSEEKYPLRGIDISNHQGKIDWNKIPKDTVHFVYIKASEGGDFKDKSFALNLHAAKKRNFPVGAYHFFTLCKPGSEQAQNFIHTVPKDNDSLPPVLDLEYTGNCGNRPPLSNVQKEIKDFLSIVDAYYGKKTILYATYEFIDAYFGNEFSDRNIWIRDIYKNPNLFSGIPWTIWQYNCRGRVPGITGPVDLNVFNGNLNTFHEIMINTAPTGMPQHP